MQLNRLSEDERAILASLQNHPGFNLLLKLSLENEEELKEKLVNATELEIYPLQAAILEIRKWRKAVEICVRGIEKKQSRTAQMLEGIFK